MARDETQSVSGSVDYSVVRFMNPVSGQVHNLGFEQS